MCSIYSYRPTPAGATAGPGKRRSGLTLKIVGWGDRSITLFCPTILKGAPSKMTFGVGMCSIEYCPRVEILVFRERAVQSVQCLLYRPYYSMGYHTQPGLDQ
jgi:hypothetical protein